MLLLEVGLPSSGLGDFQMCTIEKGEGEGEDSPHTHIAQTQLTLATAQPKRKPLFQNRGSHPLVGGRDTQKS